VHLHVWRLLTALMVLWAAMATVAMERTGPGALAGFLAAVGVAMAAAVLTHRLGAQLIRTHGPLLAVSSSLWRIVAFFVGIMAWRQAMWQLPMETQAPLATGLAMFGASVLTFRRLRRPS